MSNPRLHILQGLAVGDALGAGTEFRSPAEVAARFGHVTGYVQPAIAAFRPGDVTDDTHMTLAILAGYAEAARTGRPLLEAVLAHFQAWAASGPPDIGISTAAALRRSRTHGLLGGLYAWAESDYQSAGNGALMRAAASVVAGRRGEALLAETVQIAALTHPDPRSLGASLCLVAALEALLAGATPVAAWHHALAVLDRFDVPGAVAAAFGRAADPVAARWSAGRQAVRQAVLRGLAGPPPDQGGYVLTTLQAAVAASLAPDFLAGVLPIVNRGEDSDTAAAVAGALLGARGLTPPDHLVHGLRCGHRWPLLRHPGLPLWPALYAFVPAAGAPVPPPGTPDPERDQAYHSSPDLPPFDWDAVAPGLWLGRNPLFAGDVWDLARLGVTHILDLREPAEWAAPGRYGQAALAEVERLGLVRLHLPVRDLGAPAAADLDAAVAFLDAALALGRGVYVHCRAGRERSASVVCAFLAWQRGVSIDDAWHDLAARRPRVRRLPHQFAAVEGWLRARRGGG